MKLAGRIAAAIEVLDDILKRHTPVANALRDWGKAHRFAGSKDRSAIGSMVFDVLRQKSSLAWRMDNDNPRALVLGLLVFEWGMKITDIETAFLDDKYAPNPLKTKEKELLSGKIKLDSAPEWIKADIPEWIWPAFENNFTDKALQEAKALCARPPLDLRVNTLKSNMKEMLSALKRFGANQCGLSPVGIRIEAKKRFDKLPHIGAEACYLTGGVEIQDEGSQIVSLLVNAKAGERVLDYCAGGGGKTLALAAEMQNKGEIYAFDIDKRRLAPLYARALRAGADNIKIVQFPMSNLDKLKSKMDKVLVDAPCSGTGTWRRKPDAKWRLSLSALETRIKEQRQVLDQAKQYVKQGGYLVYVTCSVLAEENEGQIYQFLEKNPEFELVSAGEVWEEKIGTHVKKPWSEDGCSLTLTPAATDTDGFFMSVMQRIK